MSSVYVICGGSGEYEDWSERQIEAHMSEGAAIQRLRRFALDAAISEASLLVGAADRYDLYRDFVEEDRIAWRGRLSDPSLEEARTPNGLPEDQSYWISKVEVVA